MTEKNETPERPADKRSGYVLPDLPRAPVADARGGWPMPSFHFRNRLESPTSNALQDLRPEPPC